MGIRCTESGDVPGHQTKSILPDYEIRSRKQGGSRWYVFDKSSGKLAYNGKRKSDCEHFIAGDADLYFLSASHRWGM
jgi:hypothetical protein